MITHESIDCDLKLDTEHLLERAALKHLELFRQELRQFNLKRHKLTVVSPAALMVNGEAYWFELRTGSPVVDAIWRIGRTIDLAYETWGEKLVGVTL